MDLKDLLSKVDNVYSECIDGAEVKDRVIALVSGGLDSCVLLKYLSIKGVGVIALTINPRSRSSMELMSLREIAADVGVDRFIVFNVPDLYESIELKDLGFEIYRYRDSFYIPARNAIFIGIGMYVAEVFGAEVMFTAHNREDVEFFPDASSEFMASMSRIGSFYLGKRGFRVCALFRDLSKVDVVVLGKLINAPLDKSWSCYMGFSYQCGRCRGCKDRERALALADRVVGEYMS